LVRSLLADWLVRQPLDPVEVDDLVLVASELCANAVRAASGAPGALSLRAQVEGDAVVLEVEDDGSGLDRAPDGVDPEDVPDPAAEQGRGLYLVAALTDDLEVRRDGGRTVVRACKRAVVAPRTNATKNFDSAG
jgi:anti-sigma regulatory factor (Ser/Thr protein kinase)